MKKAAADALKAAQAAPKPLTRERDAMLDSIKSAADKMIVDTDRALAQNRAAFVAGIQAAADSMENIGRQALAADPTNLAAKQVLAGAQQVESQITRTPFVRDNSLLASLGLTRTTLSGYDVGVAVIDSGIQPDANIKVNKAYNFTSSLIGGDQYGHGTHIASLVASSGVASQQGTYRGVAPGARLIDMKVLDGTGAGFTSDVVRAIEFAVANKDALRIDVINLSVGHPIYEPAATDPLVQAVEMAVHSGIVVVVAAANMGADPTTKEIGYGGITSPGNAPSALTVGSLNTQGTATRTDDVVAPYSSRGPSWYDAYQKPDILAPGHKLVADVAANSWLYRSYPGSIVVEPDSKSATL
jgi:serine protease AprX